MKRTLKLTPEVFDALPQEQYIHASLQDTPDLATFGPVVLREYNPTKGTLTGRCARGVVSMAVGDCVTVRLWPCMHFPSDTYREECGCEVPG